MVTKFITEVLDEINKDVSLFQTTYKKNGNGSPLERIFYHAFTPDGKFLLPEGKPPFKAEERPQGTGQVNFIAEIRKFGIFCRKDLTPMKRESLFIQLLEAIHPNEAEVMLAIKDQTLTTLYPNITRQVVAAAGFIPPIPNEELVVKVAETVDGEKKVEAAQPKKPGRPRGRPVRQKINQNN